MNVENPEKKDNSNNTRIVVMYRLKDAERWITKSIESILDICSEIVILDDYSDNEKTREILDFYVSSYDIVYEQRNLLKDFASQKNYLKNMGSGDYSFNLDADEMISLWMIKNVHEIIQANEGIDLIYLPRINTVDGITDEHCRMYGYKVNEEGWINFPDWQGRIFRNRPNIRWQHKVHEMITGFQTYATLPTD